MFRLSWITDLHFNFLPFERVDEFLGQVANRRPDAVVLTGDVSEAHDLTAMLEHIDDLIQQPLYFVLGNHDYYHGSIRDIRVAVTALCETRPRLHYLTALGEAIELTPSVALVGHDGWADARLGDYERSMVMMNDYRLIAELTRHTKLERWALLKALGDEAAAHIRKVLPPALDRYPRVILATHVPPLREACWHEGQLSDDEWAPHFTCKAMGDAILEIMDGYPHRELTVLCGHTHSSGQCRPLPNIQIFTGGSRYGFPEISRVFELE